MRYLLSIFMVLLLSTTALADTVTHGLTIPSAHPRLWLSGSRLTTAQAWWTAGGSFTPTADRWEQLMFAANVGGSTSYCTEAINNALTVTAIIASEANGTQPSDTSRGSGEHAILAYDWCYNQMTQGQRDTLKASINSWLTTLAINTAWGGSAGPLPGYVQNNYFWGNLRNLIEWSIASYDENTVAAETFLDEAFNDYLPLFNSSNATFSKGGVAQEGVQYGRYLQYYSVIPFISANVMGSGLYGMTDFFKGSVFHHIYSTTPAITYTGVSTSTGISMFPTNVTETWQNGNVAIARLFMSNPGSYTGDFMQTMASNYSTINVGRYAQQWVNAVGVTPYLSYHIRPFVGSVTPLAYSNLPLDYYAQGPQQLFARKAWDATSSVLHLNIGKLSGVGHAGEDYGAWQMWRDGRWLSRKTTGYIDYILGYNSAGSMATESNIATNSILINPDTQGCVSGSTCTPQGSMVPGGGGVPDMLAPPTVTRLESATNYTFTSVDMTGAYKYGDFPNHMERHNPAVTKAVRDFVFIRDLETLVIFDRLESNAVGAVPAANIKKTFLAHCENNWTLEDANHASCVNGLQTLRMTNLVPAAPTYHVTTEGGTLGQYRLEVTDSGSAQSYFVTVLQSKATVTASITPTVVDNGSTYTVTLDGTHSILLNKGMTSTGGSITLSGATTAFTSSVQNMSITDDGPVWGAASPVNGACGSVNGTAVSSLTSGSAGLCTGTVNSFTGNGPWTWGCNGLNGGTNTASTACSASLTSTPATGVKSIKASGKFSFR